MQGDEQEGTARRADATTVFVASPRALGPGGEGLRLVFGRPSTPLDGQFLASRARAAIVDLRGGAELREALGVLAEPVARQHAALLVIVPPDDPAALAAARDAGATHLLVAPFAPSTLAATMAGLAETGRKLAGDWSGEQIGPARDGDGRRASTRDMVTGVRDAAAARRWLDRRLAPGKPPGIHVLLLSLSRFELVNTAYGRAAGDAVLRTVAARVEAVADELLGRDGMVARMGGSEFAVLGRLGLHRERLTLLADRLAEVIARPFVSGGAIVTLSARMGAALAIDGDTDACRLLRHAGEALDSAREAEAPGLRLAAQVDGPAPYDLAVDLHRAIERNEIEVLFQPQVAIGSERIVGVEALARWSHPTLGLLGAETLFGAAGRADLVAALSDQVRHAALATAARWNDGRAALRLSLNVTAADIARANFADNLVALVEASGFPCDRLTVEVTEDRLIDDLAGAADLFAQLRASGVRVAIDDFGTGYSSLAYLKSLPLDYLKIDKRLAQDIAGSARDRIVVRSVIEMGRSLGLTVIAEGVETAEQLDLLAQEGCNLYQGFLCAEPLSDDALGALIAARSNPG